MNARFDRSSLAPLRYKQNRLQQLRGFCLSAELGSMSQAARRLMLSQPSVSLQIQALEHELGVALFDRRGPRITLTAAGRMLLDLARPLVEAIDGLDKTFSARRDDGRSGPLDIAAGESTILYLLPRFVRRFTRLCPNVDLTLHNVSGREGLAMLRRGQVDFAVGPMLDRPADIDYQPIFKFDTVLITSRNHPLTRKRHVTLQAIGEQPLILPPRHLTTWSIVDRVFRENDLTYNVRLEAGGWEVIKRYVALGLGVSIVSAICITGRDRLAAIPLHGLFPERTYGLVRRRGKNVSPQAERFIDLLLKGARRPVEA